MCRDKIKTITRKSKRKVLPACPAYRTVLRAVGRGGDEGRYWTRKVVLSLCGEGRRYRAVQRLLNVIWRRLRVVYERRERGAGRGGKCQLGISPSPIPLPRQVWREGRGPDINVINMLISSLFLAPSIVFIRNVKRIDCSTQGEQYSREVSLCPPLLSTPSTHRNNNNNDSNYCNLFEDFQVTRRDNKTSVDYTRINRIYIRTRTIIYLCLRRRSSLILYIQYTYSEYKCPD